MSKLLKSNRIWIRPFLEKDLPGVRKLMEDPEIMKYTGFGVPQSEDKILERFKEWVSGPPNPFGVFCIEDISIGDFVGWVMLKMTNYTNPELGFMIAKKRWGVGYASESSEMLIHYAFSELKCEGVLAFTHIENIASQVVLKKIGMKAVPEIRHSSGDSRILSFQVRNLR